MCSEVDLQHFHLDYGLLARMAYTHAMDATRYNQKLLFEIGSLTLQALEAVLKDISNLNFSNLALHKITLISPREKWDAHVVSLPSCHIFQLL